MTIEEHLLANIYIECLAAYQLAHSRGAYEAIIFIADCLIRIADLKPNQPIEFPVYEN